MNPEPSEPKAKDSSRAGLIVPEESVRKETAALHTKSAELIRSVTDEEKQIETAQREEIGLLEIEERRLRNLGLSHDIQARQTYASSIFRLICWWLASILIVLILQGFLSKREIVLNFPLLGSHWKTSIHFELAEGLLLALVGGTTATVLGLFVIVANYFFPKRPPPN